MNKPISKFAEIFGRLATVYTGSNTEPEQFQKLITSKRFVTGLVTSNVYGPGIYAVYDKEKYKTFYGDYGKYIYKLAIDTTGFFSFNLETIKILYPSLVKNIQMREISKEEFEKYIGFDDEDGNLIGSPLYFDNSRKVFFEDGTSVPGSKTNEHNEVVKKTKEEIRLRKYDPSKKYFVLPSYKDILFAEAELLGLSDFKKNYENLDIRTPEYEPEYTSQIAISMWKSLYPRVRGLLFNGSRDGNVAVIYDYDNLNILSYTTIDKDSQEISGSSKIETKDKPGWLPTSDKEYLSELGDYSQMGGEKSVREVARRNINIAIEEGLPVDFRSNEAFKIEKEYALDLITAKINSGNVSDVNQDFVSFLVGERIRPGSKDIEKLKPIFAKLADSNVYNAQSILGSDVEGKLTETYLEWREANKNLFNTQYFTSGLVKLDSLALKNNPNELKNKIIEALQYPDNIGFFSQSTGSLNDLFDVFPPDFFKEIYRKYAENFATQFPILFLEGKSLIPDASSDITSKAYGKSFSKSESTTILYPDLVEAAILNLKKINGLSDLGFIKNIPSEVISPRSIDKIKELLETFVKSEYFDCNKIDAYSLFSSKGSENQNIIDDLKKHALSVCQSSGKIVPPPPTQPTIFTYSGPGNKNTVTEETIDQIARYLLENFSDSHYIYINGAWIDPKLNSNIMAKFNQLNTELYLSRPAPPPPPPATIKLPPVPTGPTAVQSPDEQAEGELKAKIDADNLDKVEASSNFRRIKIGKLLLALDLLGISSLELKKLI